MEVFRKIFVLLITSFLLYSCGDDDPVEVDHPFVQFEKQWLSTDSDEFGIVKGSGAYYYYFEDGVVTHYVSNGKLDGIIYTWNYDLLELEGSSFIELLNSACWISDNGGEFQIVVNEDADGFELVRTTTVEEYEFSISEPTFPLELEHNGCSTISNEWLDNYTDIVMELTTNERFHKVVFNDGTAYIKPNRTSGFNKAFTYSSGEQEDIEFLEILEICPDYEEDFQIQEGRYTVNEFNNVDGEGNNGFVLTQGTVGITYFHSLDTYPDALETDCYTTVF